MRRESLGALEKTMRNALTILGLMPTGYTEVRCSETYSTLYASTIKLIFLRYATLFLEWENFTVLNE